MHAEKTVKVDCLLLLRYYHIFFYSCFSFLIFAGANAKSWQDRAWRIKKSLSYQNCTIFLFLWFRWFAKPSIL